MEFSLENALFHRVHQELQTLKQAAEEQARAEAELRQVAERLDTVTGPGGAVTSCLSSSEQSDVLPEAGDRRAQSPSLSAIQQKDILPLGEGAWGWVHHRLARVIPRENGKPRQVIGRWRDITDYRYAEEELRRSSESFSKTFHGAPVAAFIISSKKKRYVEVNRTFERVTGYHRDEIIDHPFPMPRLGADLGKPEQALPKLPDEGIFWSPETRVRTKTGERVAGILLAETVRFSGEPCILAVIGAVDGGDWPEESLQEGGPGMGGLPV